MKTLTFEFTCEEWGSCYEDWAQEFEVDVNDPEGVEIEAQCDVCRKWHLKQYTAAEVAELKLL